MQKSRSVRVILDTSAYVAALLSKTGGAAAVFERIIQQRLFNFYTAEILSEVRRVLARLKFGLEREKQDHFLHLIQETSFEVQPLKSFKYSNAVTRVTISSYRWPIRLTPPSSSHSTRTCSSSND